MAGTDKALYVVGGKQRSPRSLWDGNNGWYDYRQGLILRIQPETGTAETAVEYVSPPEARGPDDPVLFKAATLENGRLYACTQTEVLVYALPSFELHGYLSLPCFNDVHHVRPTPDGNLLIANSGLEMVLEVQADGTVVREWNVLGENPWGRYSRGIDYRRGQNLKPHRAHPNHVFYVGEDVWATRFEQRDVVCLTRPGRRLHIGMERVHDGLWHKGRLYLTTVDGRLVIADPHALRIEAVVDLNGMHPKNVLLGWCRGLLVEDDRAWIGFSRIRPTKFREAVSWVRQRLSHSQPTHIACYDLTQGRCLAEVNLEPYGLNAVFSIHREA